MIFERIFEATLYVNNPISFCVNKLNNVTIEIENNYVNKCYQGSYIIKLNEILQTSSCRISNVSLTNNGVIDVKFSAMICVINKWDIIVGARIIENKSIIVGVYKDNGMEVGITIKPTTILSSSILLGQILPVRTIKALHKTKTNQIAMAGIVLTCDVKADVYKVTGELNKSYLPEINVILDSIKIELKNRMDLLKTQKDKVLYFEKLLYSYKQSSTELSTSVIVDKLTYTSFNTGITEDIVNIFEMINKNMIGYWHRPLTICRSSPVVVYTTIKPTQYVRSLPHIIIIDFAKHILSFLIAVRELVETYNTPELIASHENIWNIMRSKQV